jgi:hypothetical protein
MKSWLYSLALVLVVVGLMVITFWRAWGMP